VAEFPRLNGVIKAWEQGRPAFSTFAQADRRAAIELINSPYDSVIYEMEHNPWDIVGLQDALQYMLDRKQIVASASLTPAITPIVRIPPNGAEKNQYFAKQALDRGVYGIVWPHISNAEEAYNAVASCRYPRPKNAPIYEPEGARGDAPLAATRYWGLPLKEYYKKADVWPLSPQGEILVFLMIEDTQGIANLDEILRTVPGVGCILIGEGDLSQELGVPREYEHPLVRSAMAQVVETCRKYKVPVGHPHVSSKNLEMVLAEGFQFLMSMPTRGYAVIEKARVLTGGAAARDSSNEVAVT
jgi:4-hydroxy-2-oxoheptanedioate aldolase